MNSEFRTNIQSVPKLRFELEESVRGVPTNLSKAGRPDFELDNKSLTVGTLARRRGEISVDHWRRLFTPEVIEHRVEIKQSDSFASFPSCGVCCDSFSENIFKVCCGKTDNLLPPRIKL